MNQALGDGFSWTIHMQLDNFMQKLSILTQFENCLSISQNIVK